MAKMKTTHTTEPTVFLHGFSGDGDGLKPFALAYVGDDAICIDLPGFGNAPEPIQPVQDIYAYCDAVWQAIRKAVPHGSLQLVGHSHGAMIGYVLALQHANEITKLTLVCPVARPRLAPRAAAHFLALLSKVLPAKTVVAFIASYPMVSLVTRYSFMSSWSHEVRHRIATMRQREAAHYSPVMLELMGQTVQFKNQMAKTQCTVPTYLYYVTDDNIASNDDYQWYKEHADIKGIQSMNGGHLCVVAEPEKIAQAMQGIA